MWGHKTNDAPLTINPVVFSGGAWTDPNGVQHPRGAFTKAAFRAANNIVELVEPTIDERYYIASAPLGTFTLLSPGVYEIDRNVIQKPFLGLLQTRIDEVETLRRSVLYGGITSQTKPVSTVPSELHTFDLMALTVLLGNRAFPPGGVKVATMEGERVNMNETQFKQLMDDLALHFYNTDINADMHIVAINALSTQQELIDYDITTGWPANPVL